MIVMSAETAAEQQKILEQAVREALPASKADIDRLFDEIRRVQDTLSAVVRGSSSTVQEPPK